MRSIVSRTTYSYPVAIRVFTATEASMSAFTVHLDDTYEHVSFCGSHAAVCDAVQSYLRQYPRRAYFTELVFMRPLGLFRTRYHARVKRRRHCLGGSRR